MGSLNCGWEIPVGFPDLSKKQVHVWQVNTSDFNNRSDKFRHLLNENEKTRVSQFKYGDSKKKFIVCRGALRFLLSRYLDENPALIGIVQNPDGKPELGDEHNQEDLDFNISHSDEICLIALSQNLELGIDVEALKPLVDLEDMAKSFLSEIELKAFDACTAEKKLKMFYDLWSAKEALLKAIGCGLMIQPRQIEISEIREKKKFSVQHRSNVIDIPHIEMHELDGISGYTAWLAVVGEVGEIRKFRLSQQLVSI